MAEPHGELHATHHLLRDRAVAPGRDWRKWRGGGGPPIFERKPPGGPSCARTPRPEWHATTQGRTAVPDAGGVGNRTSRDSSPGFHSHPPTGALRAFGVGALRGRDRRPP